MRRTLLILTAAVVFIAVLASAGCIATDSPSGSGDTITITDAFGREVTIPADPQKVAVSGSGSMRYFVYLGVDSDRFVIVDYQDSNIFENPNELRPYLLAHPELQEKEAIGPAMAKVDNEKLLASGADILFMGGASSSNAEVANEIQEKTGVPVVMFYTGNYATDSEKICDSLMMIAEIFHVEDRATELINYFESVEDDLQKRAAAYSGEKPTVYVGGVAYNGAHGIDATKALFYPFMAVDANNIATGKVESTVSTGYAKISKEQILAWNPDIIFVDLATLKAAEGGALYELENDPSLQHLTAVQTGQVYTINPDTSMNANHETALANAYYIGKILYPEQFADIDPEKKADEIYEFVVGAPVYEKLKANVQGLSYQQVTFNI